MQIATGNIKDDNYWIEVRRKGHDYIITNDNITAKGDDNHDDTDLGLADWDDEVINRDTNSDGFDCFGMSTDLVWKNVTMTPDKFHAPSIERLCEALEHVQIRAWCPGDI